MDNGTLGKLRVRREKIIAEIIRLQVEKHELSREILALENVGRAAPEPGKALTFGVTKA